MNIATAEPLNLVHPSASHYLDELGYAVRMARHERDRAALVHRDFLTLAPDGPRHDRQALSSGCEAMNSPVVWLRSRQYEQVCGILHAAEETFARMAAWYARAAVITCRAVLAQKNVTAAQLEQETLVASRKPAGADQNVGPFWRPTGEAQRPGAFWRAAHRPALPALGELDTGHVGLDKSVHEAQKPLEVAYDAAESVDGMEEDQEHWVDPAGEVDEHGSPYLTEWEASDLHTWVAKAEKIPDLLAVWAEAVAHAAMYGRSRAYGHQ